MAGNQAMATDPQSPEKRICRNPFDESDYGVPGTLVDAPRTLDRGFLGRGGDLLIEEGTVVLLTEDGRLVDTLAPGKYPLKAFKHRSRLNAYTVHTLLNTFMFTANNYFRISEKTARGFAYFPVNVSLGIEFRVKPENAYLLISRIKQPVPRPLHTADEHRGHAGQADRF